MAHRDLMAEAEEFLLELGRGLPEDQRLIASYPDEATVQIDATGKKLNSGFWPTPYKPGKFIPTEKNAYVCISSSIKTQNPKTGDMRYWRGEQSFGNGLAIMVDDIGDGKGSKGDFALDEFTSILRPTAVVETSPGNYQLWYFFKEPLDNMRYFKAFLNCFVVKVLKKGGDNTIKDIARYGRMPIGINNKREKNGSFKYCGDDGKSYRVHLKEKDYSIRYTPEEIAAAFRFDIELPKVRAIEINEDEFAYDVVWFRMASKILNQAGMGEGSHGEVVENMSGKIRIRCPWGHEHGNGDPYGAYFRAHIPGADYSYVFGCAHDVCRKENRRTWSAFVDAVVMPTIEGELEMVNLQAAGLV